MKIYKYVAKANNGKTIKGIIEAEDISDFYHRLEQNGLFCLDYTEDDAKSIKIKTIYKLKAKDLVLFCRKLGTTLSSGMSITSSLDIMSESADNPKLVKIYSKIYESIKGGNTLSYALKECGDAFPPLLINMIESGEESGNIDLICKKLGIYYERQAKLASKIKTATIYPKLLGVLSIGVVMILFTFVLPNIFEIFVDMELPPLTRFMMACSDFVMNYWYIVIAFIVAVIMVFKMILTIPETRQLYDRAIIKIPMVGKLLKKIYSARFASTLSILYASGLSLLNGIHLSVNVISNSYIESKLAGVVEKISVGNSLSASIEEIDVFDKMLSNMIKIGEETGNLDTILTTSSEFFEQETESAIDSLLGILEPVLLIIMAIIIGSILVAVMLPIFQGYGTIGK